MTSAQRCSQGTRPGTPATRADTIERLIGRSCLARGKQGVRATAKALRLVEVLDLAGVVRLTSAELTGDMEKKLEVEAKSLAQVLHGRGFREHCRNDEITRRL